MIQKVVRIPQFVVISVMLTFNIFSVTDIWLTLKKVMALSSIKVALNILLEVPFSLSFRGVDNVF